MNEITFKKNEDPRGVLISLEIFNEIPFEIKRIYYIYNSSSDVSRGFHAHKKLKQVLVAVSGSMTLKIENCNENKTIKLDSPEKGILIDSVCWREMYDFTDDCVLLVIASEKYDQDDYIHNYDDFRRIVESVI